MTQRSHTRSSWFNCARALSGKLRVMLASAALSRRSASGSAQALSQASRSWASWAANTESLSDRYTLRTSRAASSPRIIWASWPSRTRMAISDGRQGRSSPSPLRKPAVPCWPPLSRATIWLAQLAANC
ncbi:hypothetical protein D3C79_802880 [compost metagenome]